MNPKLIGRERELKTLNRLLESPESEFLALYGRRRIGKTFLIREGLKKNLTFELTGQLDAPLADQLENFAILFRKSTRRRTYETPSSWRDAFHDLAEWLENLPRKGKKVIFIDELPWLASPRSKFLSALDIFWNTWASRRHDILLVICGSAASWMIRKVIHHKGGLHNRVTASIRLDPFTLYETRLYLRKRKVALSDFHIAELYLAFGGVPHYLSAAQPGQSPAQMIQQACFTSQGLLANEFEQLYPALFDSPERHLAVVKALAKKQSGLTRNELATAIGYSPSGRFTRILEELEESAFIESVLPHGKQVRDTLYRLLDEFSLFHLRWMATPQARKSIWTQKRGTPAWRSWSGYAFENLCFRHLPQIKSALGIAGVETSHQSWRHQPEEGPGAQVDLLLDRADGLVNLIEAKFTESPFAIDKAYTLKLATRRQIFIDHNRSAKSVTLNFVTSCGLAPGKHALDYIATQVTLADLFKAPPE